MTELSIILPAYNEARSIQAGKLAQVADWLAIQPISNELLVIDDGSQDATAELACSIATRVVTIPHKGKAAAIIAGIRAATATVILFSDMDQATPISEAPKLLRAIEEGADLAIGSRGLARPGAPPGRYLLSWGQVVLRNLLIGLNIADTQCGFKAMTRVAALDILEHLRLYHPDQLTAIHAPSVTSGFDVELLFVAQRLGYQIREVPVAWNYQQTRRVNLVRDAWRGVRDLLNILRADFNSAYPKAANRPKAID